MTTHFDLLNGLDKLDKSLLCSNSKNQMYDTEVFLGIHKAISFLEKLDEEMRNKIGIMFLLEEAKTHGVVFDVLLSFVLIKVELDQIAHAISFIQKS